MEIDKEWYQELELKKCGMYYEGYIDEKKLGACLEKHRMETASTFGTRKSSRTAENVYTFLNSFMSYKHSYPSLYHTGLVCSMTHIIIARVEF